MEKPKQPFLPLDRQPVLSLITPSASPPASRSTSHARDGQPSPAKRPRLNFTPSTVSSPSPSVRAQSQPEAPKFDFEAARHESTMRVLNVWSQLAERYTRRLDEDDIIDLRSGNVIKDRGILRKAQAEYRFGYITQDDGPSNDASSDGGAITEGEDDLDEVDALVADEGISAELNAELERVKHKGFDAADQDDLREFLEAEKRIQDGHEVDEDYSDDEIGDLSTIMRGEEEEEAEMQVLAPERDDAESGGTDWEELPDGVDGGAAISSGEESEDELGAWEPDESNAVYAVSTELSDTEPPTGPPFSFSDHNEGIEISDTPPSSPSPRRAQNISAVHSTLPVRAAPDTAKSRPLKRRRSPSVAVQLQTPPRSFSSYTDDSEVPLANLSPTTPSRLSALSRFDSEASAVFPATSARKTSSSAIAGSSTASASSSLRQEESASGKKPKSVKKKASRTSLVPEVVLERRSHHHSVPRRTSSISTTNDKRLTSTASAPCRPDKGKARARADSPGQPSKHPPSVSQKPSRKTHSPSLSPLDSKGKGRAASPIVIEISSDEEEVRPLKPSSSRDTHTTPPMFDEDPEPPGPSNPPSIPTHPPTPGPHPHPQQVQYYLAQAMQHLSYFMDAAGISNPQMPLAPGPPPQGPSHHTLPYSSPSWTPQTPIHHSRPDQGSSRRNGPSHASTSKRPIYGNATPHPRSSFLSTPSSSFATLPPSSPEPASSPSITSSLKQRSPSRGRSRPLGRRVSFKLGDGPPVVSGRSEDDSDSDSSLDPLASTDLDVPLSSSPAVRAATPAAGSARQHLKPLQRQMLGRSGSKGRPKTGVFERGKR